MPRYRFDYSPFIFLVADISSALMSSAPLFPLIYHYRYCPPSRSPSRLRRPLRRVSIALRLRRYSDTLPMFFTFCFRPTRHVFHQCGARQRYCSGAFITLLSSPLFHFVSGRHAHAQVCSRAAARALSPAHIAYAILQCYEYYATSRFHDAAILPEFVIDVAPCPSIHDRDIRCR